MTPSPLPFPPSILMHTLHQHPAGDLHLKDIRQWRQAELGVKRGWKLQFPLFDADYSYLSGLLASSPAVVRVSAVTERFVGLLI